MFKKYFSGYLKKNTSIKIGVLEKIEEDLFG